MFLLCAIINIFATTETSPIKQTNLMEDVPSWSDADNTLVKERLELMESPISLIFDEKVKQYIRSYTTTGYVDTEKMLGNTPLYFSVFEHYLNLYNMPEQLKYLPIIESKLNPHVTSKAGAVGLWQFMPETAKELGLSIGSYSDERRDPHKSTDAAVRHLKNMYETFGNWELAIAAYNCGAGNVRKAIRLSGSQKYNAIKSFLPSETRNYLPRFIAASYIAENFHYHEINPRYPKHELRLATSMKLYSSMTFRKIAGLSGVDIADIKLLNPSYSRSVIPANRKGNYLILPEIGMVRLQNHLKYSDIKTDVASINDASSGAQRLLKETYLVKRGDTISEIASAYRCSSEDIRTWNGLVSNNIYYNQKLILFVENNQLALK